jgi:ankyrin repeat protein
MAALLLFSTFARLVVNERQYQSATLQLVRAVQSGDRLGAARALDAGANPNARYFSSYDQSPESVLGILARIFLRSRREPNDQPTVLIQSASKGSTSMVGLLLDRGADPNADWGKHVAVMDAARISDPNMVRTLIRHGADVNVRDDQGLTPVMLAAARGNDGTLKALIAARGKVNPTTDEGETALMFAAQEGHTNAANVLLSAGANVAARDVRGKSASDHAFGPGAPALRRILRNVVAHR